MSSARRGVSVSGYFLLPAYIGFETTRALLLFAAFQSQVGISSTVVTFLSELLKLVFALLFLLRYLAQHNGYVNLASIRSAIFFASGSQPAWRVYGPFAIPAALYLTNNLLYLLGLQLTAPALLHVALLTKLPLTGILHHFLIRPQTNPFAWISLVFICVGLLIFNAPAELLDWMVFKGTSTVSTPTGVSVETGLFIAPLLGLTIATLSAGASIFTEVVLKKDLQFWVAQFWLYLYGTVFAGCVLLFWDGRVNAASTTASLVSTSWAAAAPVYGAVIMTTAATGLVVAKILRQADNLVKIVGTSSCVVMIIVAQVILFPDLRAKTIQTHTTLGVGILAVSTWTYNYYKGLSQGSRIASKDAEEYALAADIEDQDGLPSGANKDGWRKSAENRTSITTPNWKKVTGVTICVVLLTYTTSFYAPSVP